MNWLVRRLVDWLFGSSIGLLISAFAENLVGLAFLWSVSYIKSIPAHEKAFAVLEKVAEMPLFNLIFLGLGWPWVGEFVGFIIIFARYMFCLLYTSPSPRD